MPKYTVVFEETVVNTTTIEAKDANEAAATAKKMIENDTFPNDTPERQRGEIFAYPEGASDLKGSVSITVK